MIEKKFHIIPPKKGRAVLLKEDQAIKIINTHGTQVVDTWCFNKEDIKEFMSMEHNRAVTKSIFPKEGDLLYTNRRNPILHLEKDTSPGNHDTLIAACDTYRYKMLGCDTYHENCTDNLYSALSSIGISSDKCPSPLNLWMNIPVNHAGEVEFAPPMSIEKDYVILRAKLNCVLVMSTCPMDLLPINGKDCIIREIHYQIIDP